MRWFLLYASIVVFFLAGSSAPTPLYPVYQASWGFTSVTVTVVFGIYALAVLATLLVVGSLSDHVGRRPVLLVATLVQALAMVIFASAHGVGALVIARIVQGLATGAAAGAAGAGMIDVDRERGMVVNGVVPMVGTGLGSVLSGLFVQYLPGPTSLVYLVLGAI
ncbi:MAG TPA: MFS transporter, partial [Polyangiaceae bacterium]